MDVAVAIGTFGDEKWIDLARSRALPSSPVPAVHRHRDTLAEARNAALAAVDTEWVIFLDADDELEPGYVEAMARGTADLRAPAVRYVKGGDRHRAPYVPRVASHRHDCTADCLRDGNWLVIGTAVRAQMLRDVGGWREWPCYEDWDAWVRCWLAGASVEAIPDAIYRAHVNRNSRNRGQAMKFKDRVHAEIVAANFPEPLEAA